MLALEGMCSVLDLPTSAKYNGTIGQLELASNLVSAANFPPQLDTGCDTVN
jgi:hypothetical protein